MELVCTRRTARAPVRDEPQYRIKSETGSHLRSANDPSWRPSTVADMATRRFPRALRADKSPGGYVVRDANRQGLRCLTIIGTEALT